MPSMPTMLSSLPRQTYDPVPSAPNTPGFMAASPPLTGNSMKKYPFPSEDGVGERWPGPPSPISPEVVKTNMKLKRRIRIMRVFHRICLTALAIAATALEGQTLALFIRTKDVQRGGRGPWAKKTSLWPSILLLSASATTVLVGTMVLFSYARSIRLANNLAMLNATIIIVTEIAGFVAWVMVAVFYRLGRTGKDLWGWACSPLALNIQPNFKGVLNFDKVCQRGSTNWGLSIASAATNILSLLVWYFVYQRRKYQKIQRKMEHEGGGGMGSPQEETFKGPSHFR